ncbi:30S ribosomal protein S20 [Candidatus Saccharibacteria bacterium]|nr:30S ribosomal protein S20 [Candidatus Saccharibacteria bacterium]
MPIIKSAKKRVRIADKATARNRKTKRNVKSSIKALMSSISGDKKQASELLSKAQREIDFAVKKGVLHKNKGARKKSQLAKLSKEAGIKPSSSKEKTTKKPAKKATTAKSTAKKPTKKPATKKATPKS